MNVIIAGSGKLATELLGMLKVHLTCHVVSWAARGNDAAKSLVVHAGSGRELDAITAFCEATRSPLIELATGSKIGPAAHAFPIILCPNTNILILKFMSMMERSGHLFSDYQVTLIESHQAQKTSTPGTAVSLAKSLGLPNYSIRSVRDPKVQKAELQIPDAHLARHAYHQILIQDGECSLKLETRVYGETPYADGVARIAEAVRSRNLENRLYSILEFVENGWL